MSSLDELDDDYTKKKASYDNLPTFKREMTERYDTVNMILVIIFFLFLWFHFVRVVSSDSPNWHIEITVKMLFFSDHGLEILY